MDSDRLSAETTVPRSRWGDLDENDEPRACSDVHRGARGWFVVFWSAGQIVWSGQGKRASKKPGARSGPRLVVCPVGGPTACG